MPVPGEMKALVALRHVCSWNFKVKSVFLVARPGRANRPAFVSGQGLLHTVTVCFAMKAGKRGRGCDVSARAGIAANRLRMPRGCVAPRRGRESEAVGSSAGRGLAHAGRRCGCTAVHPGPGHGDASRRLGTEEARGPRGGGPSDACLLSGCRWGRPLQAGRAARGELARAPAGGDERLVVRPGGVLGPIGLARRACQKAALAASAALVVSAQGRGAGGQEALDRRVGRRRGAVAGTRGRLLGRPAAEQVGSA